MTDPRRTNLPVLFRHPVLTAQVGAAAVILTALLRLFGAGTVLARLEAHTAPRGRFTNPGTLEQIILALSSLQLFVIRNNCLKRSVLLYYFLARAGGEDLRLHIGVFQRSGRLWGHSWLTRAGSVFLDDPSFTGNFHIIYSIGPVAS